MTKKLEELLNLPDSKEIIQKAENLEEDQRSHDLERQQETMRDIAEFDKIASALPAVKGLGEMADKELNEIADKAMSAYEDLMDLGMNVESRYASRVFEVAGGLLKTSLDAKVAKLDKKLKMIELQLKKEKMDKDSSNGDDGMIEGKGYVVTDRNSLLQRLKGLDKDK
jgi:excinuclease UvrABC ATPase subunit|tara:strand:- start:5876 stop:6379 length:504 start_codon:yes stop_codon:yes gene_type:complete